MNEQIRETASLGEKLAEALSFKTVFAVEVAGFRIPVTETVVVSWAIMFVLIVGSFFLTRRLKIAPGKTQSALELAVGGFNSFCEEKMGHHWRTFAPFLLSVSLYLAFSNVISIFSPTEAFGFVPSFEIKPPTRDINVTAAYAVTVIIVVLVSGIRVRGPMGWFKRLFKPMPFMLPFNLMEYFIRPLSLALRLFGNIFGAFVIMRLIEIVIPVFIPPVFAIYFDLFDGLIQAVVFVFLSTIFIAEAIE